MTTTAPKPPVPDGLRASGTALWTDVTTGYELRSDELVVLEAACRTADIVDTIAAALVTAPLIIAGSQGQDRIHPLLPELRGQRLLLAQLLKQLSLPDTDRQITAAGVRSTQARAAALTRWSHRSGA